MNLIEKDKLYQWASQNSTAVIRKRVFSEPSKRVESYLTDFTKFPELEIYDIHTALDIRRMMDRHLDDCLTEIKNDCIISMIKNNRTEENHKSEEKDTCLPEYIYNF